MFRIEYATGWLSASPRKNAGGPRRKCIFRTLTSRGRGESRAGTSSYQDAAVATMLSVVVSGAELRGVRQSEATLRTNAHDQAVGAEVRVV